MKHISTTALIVSSLLNTAYCTSNEAPRQIAIIGAGAAGSTTASYLQKYAQECTCISLNITIFEKTDRIGGRTLTVNPYDDPSIRLELGASIFIEKNKILYDSLAEFNLSKRDPDGVADPTLGIWDGDGFVFTINQKDSYWWNAGKAILRYGFLAPRRTQKLMEATIRKFLKLYEAPNFPFRSLNERAYTLDLIHATSVTGEQLLKENKVDDLYAHDIVQASTRVNYASNLAAIHGLDTMVSMAPEGAMAVEGGNWQIFHKMVEKSGANLVLNTSIISIDLAEEKGRKYKLQSESETYPTEFDTVVIATPYQFANLSFGEGVIQQHIDKIPYVQLHVTLFASPFRYSPRFFGKEDGASIPATVLTTLGKDDTPTSGVQGAGKAGFYSISTLRKAVNPKTQREEYLYKIFSPEKVTPEFLTRLFGIPVPDSYVDADIEGQESGKLEASPITWYYPHVFNSYPKAYPRVTFQDPIIGKGVYYTSGMESFIPTMETNALMGKNVARLIVDELLDEKRKEADEKWEGVMAEIGQQEIMDLMEEEERQRQRRLKIECDRGGVLKNGEVPKTRPVQPLFEDL